MQLAGASQRASGLHWRSTRVSSRSFGGLSSVLQPRYVELIKTSVINAESPQITRPLRVYLETHLAHVELIKSETTKRARLHLQITVDRNNVGFFSRCLDLEVDFKLDIIYLISKLIYLVALLRHHLRFYTLLILLNPVMSIANHLFDCTKICLNTPQNWSVIKLHYTCSLLLTKHFHTSARLGFSFYLCTHLITRKEHDLQRHTEISP